MFHLKEFFTALFNKNNDNDIICNANRSKKLFFTGHEQLVISCASNSIADKVSQTAYNVLEKYKDKPHLILKFIQCKGTKTILAPELLPILKLLGYDEGFIPAHKGLKATILRLTINAATKEKIDINAGLPDLFICCKKDISLYFLAYHFHHWLAYQYNLPGYDTNTMNLFRSTFNTNANISLLSINQILSLKDAIDREKQALDFVQKFVREQVGAKQRLQNILDGKTVKI